MTAWPVLALALLLADEPFRSAEEVQSWLTYYYLKPRPELARFCRGLRSVATSIGC